MLQSLEMRKKMGEEKKGFFGRLKEGLTKTRNNIVHGIDAVFSGFSSIDDDFYEEDKAFLQDFFIRYADRIMFATDIHYEKNLKRDMKYHFENRGHMRFLNKLNLPEDVLQKIAYQNAEKIYMR